LYREDLQSLPNFGYTSALHILRPNMSYNENNYDNIIDSLAKNHAIGKILSSWMENYLNKNHNNAKKSS
jgi:hypothetical protein